VDEVNGVICFLLCVGEEDLLPPLHSPLPFRFCLCLAVWQMEGRGRGQSKNTSLECTLKNFKRGFNGD
jgi:hypothetical protein